MVWVFGGETLFPSEMVRFEQSLDRTTWTWTIGGLVFKWREGLLVLQAGVSDQPLVALADYRLGIAWSMGFIARGDATKVFKELLDGK